MQLQFESCCLVCIDIICVSEMLTIFPSWSTEFSVEITMEAGMTELLKAREQSREAQNVRKGTKCLSSATAVLGRGGCAVSCDTFTTWLSFPCTQVFGHLGKLSLSTFTLQSTVKATSFFSYRTHCCGYRWQHHQREILNKKSQFKKQIWWEKATQALPKKGNMKNHSMFSKQEEDSWKIITSQFQSYSVNLGSKKLGSF